MDGSFQTLEKLKEATSLRHKIIVSNIANADTPGYRARDLDFKGIFQDEIMPLAKTHREHIKSATANDDIMDMMRFESTPVWGDRNNVELDMEVAKMTENNLLGQAGGRLLSSKIKMFKEAVRGRQ